MARAYWIARVEVTDPETYKAYAAANPAIFRKFGGRFIVRAGRYEAIEGSSKSRQVVVEFPDYAAAMACLNSPEYRANALIRKKSSETDLVVVEGYDGPQP